VLNDETEEHVMNATARIASVLSGVTLGLGLLAGAVPAAHAGASHDRSGVETENWTQGKSLSDPDGDSNGGMDKPGFPGGVDDDQDGNNGCGNDTDREDDNNGNCGRQPEQAAAPACHDEDKIGAEAEDDDSQCPESDATVTAAARVEAAVTAAASAPADTTASASAGGTAAAAAVEVAGAMEIAAMELPEADTIAPAASRAPVAGASGNRAGILARTGAALLGLVLVAGAYLGGGRLFGLARGLLGS
jgi:hypothetical protein